MYSILCMNGKILELSNNLFGKRISICSDVMVNLYKGWISSKIAVVTKLVSQPLFKHNTITVISISVNIV